MMVTTVIYDMNRPLGSDRHVWIDMGCMCGKINVSYRIEGQPGGIIDPGSIEFFHEIARHLLLGVAKAYEDNGMEIPDLSEGIVESEGLTIILRFEVVGSDIAVPSKSVN